LASEGERDAAINNAEGKKQQVIKQSEANRQLQINEAEGEASAILARANATAEGIRKVADALQAPGGMEATQLRVAEQYISSFGELASVRAHQPEHGAKPRATRFADSAAKVFEETRVPLARRRAVARRMHARTPAEPVDLEAGVIG